MVPELLIPLGLIVFSVGYLFFWGVSLRKKDRAALLARVAVFLIFLGGLGYLIAIGSPSSAVGAGVVAAAIATKDAQQRRRRSNRRTQNMFTEQSAVLKSDFIIVRANQYTKAVSGEIIAGRFAGARLETLTFDDLVSLLADYRRDDPRSGSVLRTYLDRSQPPGWRERAERLRDKSNDEPAVRKFTLDKDDALSVLGLKEAATPEEIKFAHRAIMLKVHPDQGGTDYLAAMVNQAKEVLLGSA